MKDELDNLPDEEEAPKRRGLRRFLVFFLVLVLVLGAVMFAAYRDGTGLDVLRRFFSYGGAESNSEELTYDASGDNRFAALGDNLVILSSTQLQVLDSHGEQLYSQLIQMSNPALESGGDRAVAYDVGGTQLYVVDEKGELLLNLTAEEEAPWIAATLNRQGMLAVTSQKKGCKGWVAVYDKEMDEIFGFKSSQRFVSDAYVTDDGKSLAAVTLGQENGEFVSNIVLYNLREEEPFANYNVKDGLAFAIGQVDGELTTVSDTCLTFAGTDGEADATYDYANEYLRGYDLGGDGVAALLLCRYRAGSVGRLVTVLPDGKELASLDINEEVLGISASGHYLGVLYADRLVVYTMALQEYASLVGTDFARDILLRENGSALLLGSEKATLFLP